MILRAHKMPGGSNLLLEAHRKDSLPWSQLRKMIDFLCHQTNTMEYQFHSPFTYLYVCTACAQKQRVQPWDRRAQMCWGAEWGYPTWGCFNVKHDPGRIAAQIAAQTNVCFSHKIAGEKLHVLFSEVIPLLWHRWILLSPHALLVMLRKGSSWRWFPSAFQKLSSLNKRRIASDTVALYLMNPWLFYSNEEFNSQQTWFHHAELLSSQYHSKQDRKMTRKNWN